MITSLKRLYYSWARPNLSRFGIYLVLFTIIIAGAIFRFTGVNWDQDSHLHPDERFITMVASEIKPVSTLQEYFNTEYSTLNPLGYGFYTYGMLPLFITRYFAELISETSYERIVLVGRFLSGLFDLLVIVILFFLGKRLFTSRIGLLAAGLYAAAVLPIQLAHYFAVDSFTTVFLLGAFYAADLVREQPRYWAFALFGVLTGFAMATKVSIAPMVGLVILAGSAYLAAHWNESEKRFSNLVTVLLGWVLSGLCAGLIFRIFQPYAFSGPGFFGLNLNPQWLDIIREVNDQVAGRVDYPPNHHWAGRPWDYALVNMIQWGMGIPLGVAAALGWIWATWRCLRGDWSRFLLLVTWVGGFFLWQNSHFWRYTRYFLPVYPFLILLASWALFEAFGLARGINRLRKVFSVFAVLLISGVVFTTYTYALAFVQIYTRLNTRVAASIWMRQNFEGPINLILTTPQGNHQIPLAMPYDLKVRQGEPWSVSFSPDTSGTLSAITTHKAVSSPGDELKKEIKLKFTLQNPGGDPEILAEESFQFDDQVDLEQGIPYQFNFPSIELHSNQTYNLTLEMILGDAIQFSGVGVALETSWDDILPIRRDNFDPYGGIYKSNNLELFEPDTPSKRDQIVEMLYDSEFLVISSNRVYDAVPHLPLRYPLTLAFYQALFNCDETIIARCAYPATEALENNIGYDLVAVFESYPSLGPFRLPDQTAQESFTVYDHPKVFVFKKNQGYSRDTLWKVLVGVDLSQVIPQSAKQVTEAPSALKLSPEQFATQKQSGTWSSIFSNRSSINNSAFLSGVSWYAVLLILGWIAFPCVFFVFKGLPDRGYSLARLVGLLLIAWFAWLGSSIGIFSFSRITIWMGVGLFWVVTVMLVWRFQDIYMEFLKANWRHLVIIEAVFLLLFLISLTIRWYNPDLWHPFRGGEKPVDFSMFSAILKTATFPPYDPWYAGNFINYYYFGYVISAVPTLILGTDPSVAYNLLIPTWFALTGLGAFCIAYGASAKHSTKKIAYFTGLTALVLLLLIGNLAEVRILWNNLPNFSSAKTTEPGISNHVKDVVSGVYSLVIGKAKLLEGDKGVWYFDGTRAILNSKPDSPITEFPYFTFLYADLHPHLMDMAIVLAGLAWSLNFLQNPYIFSKSKLKHDIIWKSAGWLMGGIIIGATYAINSWDFPVLLVLCIMAVSYGVWHEHREISFRMFRNLLFHVALLVVLSMVTFVPFHQSFGAGDRGIEFWEGSRTPLRDYFFVQGTFILILGTFLWVESLHWFRPRFARFMHTPLGDMVPTLITVLVLLAISPIAGLFLVWGWKHDFQTAAFTLLMSLWVGLLLLRRSHSMIHRMVLILVGAGFGLSFLAEFIAITGDIGRTNVVFKFYLLIWMFFALASSIALSWISVRISPWKWKKYWWGVLIVCFLGAGTYTVIGTLAKVNDRWPGISDPPHTLDGLAFLQGNRPGSEFGDEFVIYREREIPMLLVKDYAAMLWVRNTVEGTPTIVEGHTSEYRWGNRFSNYTGLPTIIGWNWHLRQRNSVLPEIMVEQRIEAVNHFYNSPNIEDALEFFKRYQVDYVILGELERALYNEAGLAKFDQLVQGGYLSVVYPEFPEPGDVMIYAVR